MGKISLTLSVIALISLASLSVSAFCFEEAGGRYGIPPGLLKAIAQVESSMRPHAINHNKDGSVDY
ncbi:MAG: transglycosylase SLT domain-containing protein, partial [Pseudomonadota bacterium]